MNAQAHVFVNVNQVNPFGALVTASGSSAAPSVSVTAGINDIVMDTLAAYQLPIVGTGQTQLYNMTTGTNIYGAGSTETGTSPIAMSWSITGGSPVAYAQIGIAIKGSS